MLAFNNEVGKLFKTQSNYWLALHIRKRSHKHGMKNNSHVGVGHRHYFLKQYKNIKLKTPICTMLQNKKNIFISFLLHFNSNRFYKPSIVEVCKYSITKQMYMVSIIVQKDATMYSCLYFCNMLYIFRVVTSPNIRSTYNCNYSIWHWSNFGSRDGSIPLIFS
jgi:magnesium-transporting ATPase (P-type)